MKAHSVYIVWFAAMVVFSFLFWFTITPLLFPYSAKKGKKPSITYKPEFGLIGFCFWITFLMAFWCCFRKLCRDDHKDRWETSHLIPNSDELASKQGLNDSVKKRLGLLTPNSLHRKPKVEVSEDVNRETAGEEVGLHESQVEDVSTASDGDKPKKRGLISRLSSMRRNKTESDEPEMKIISLPDFTTENSFKLLMPHSEDSCEQCFLSDRNSFPFIGPANVWKECGKIHYSDTSNKVRLSWNSRKRKDLNIELCEEMQADEDPTPCLQLTGSPEEMAVEVVETEESYHYKHSDLENVSLTREENVSETKEDLLPNSERKSLKKTESSFLLQALHDQKNSKSEIFFVVNDFGHLVSEPEELAELHGFKH